MIRSLLIFTFVAIQFPKEIKPVDFRWARQTLTIELEKNSPAFAAFEDIKFKYKKTEDSKEHKEILLTKIKKLTPKIETVHGLTISRAIKIDHLGQLIQSAQNESRAPTVHEYAEMLVKEEVQYREHANDETYRQIQTATGGTITVAKGDLPETAGIYRGGVLPPPKAPALPNRKIDVPTQRAGSRPNLARQPDPRKSQPPPSTGGITVASNDPASVAAMKTAGAHNYKLQGPLNFAGGAAFLGDQSTVEVMQVVDGQAVTTGYVDLHEAYYEINVDDLAGDLVAEVRTRSGDIQAQGKVNLYDFKVEKVKTAKIDGIVLDVKPILSSAHGIVVAASALGGRATPLENARVKIQDLEREIAFNKTAQIFEDKNIVMPSQFMMQVQSPGHWPSFLFGQSGEPFKAQMFQDQFIQALLSLSLDKYAAREASDLGVLWGRVSMLGRPVEGAQVQVVGQPDRKPIYFSGFIPDPTKKSTTKTGELAIAGLNGGEIMLNVALGSKIYWPIMTKVLEKHVTFADLKIHGPKQISLASYDAFTQLPLEAQVTPLGSEETQYIPPVGEFLLSVELVDGLSFLEAETAEPYAKVRAMLSATQTEIDFPFVKKEWISKMQAGLPATPFNTTVVGFVNGDEYEVVLGADVPSAKIIYFDQKGERLSHPSSNAGGGYMIFGLPQGLHTVTIMPVHSKNVVTQIVYADEFAVDAVKTNLTF